ncbi:MAG TPA: hypothetical protein VKS60_00265 [Stellaceae bacterium]|nr:hypothetical protein [Stellaceae bacterium]
MISISERGMDEAVTSLRQVGPDAHRRLADAVRDEADALAAEAVGALPPGPLAASIRVTVDDAGDTVTATIGSDDPAARFLEAGTRPHVIEARSARALRFFAHGREVFAKRVDHPGTRPHPFLTGAFADRAAAIAARLAAAVAA